MPLGIVVPHVLVVMVYYFAGGIIHVRRSGPITDGSLSEATGGTAFRVVGPFRIVVGAVEFLRAYASW